MKKLTYFFFIILFSTLTFAKGKTILDTVNVTTLERFKVPANKNIVIANVLKINFTSTLLDENFNKIRDCKDVYMDPSPEKLRKKARGGRGSNVQYAVFETVDKEGVYYIKVDIKVRGEKGSGHKTVYYMVRAKYPEILAPIQLNPKGYFYSEHKSFSFATAQFKDASKYSYKIFSSAGNMLLQGTGPVVVLDSLLNSLQLVGQKLKIVGYYGDKPFNYREIGQSDVHKSEWEITINKPTLDEFTDWHNTEKPGDPTIISAYNDKAMKILYSYFGKTENGFVVIQPKIKSLTVSAQPDGLIASYTPIQRGSWLFVVFKLSDDYLGTLEEYAEIDAKIAVKFRTQFGEVINRTYDATIYK